MHRRLTARIEQEVAVRIRAVVLSEEADELHALCLQRRHDNGLGLEGVPSDGLQSWLSSRAGQTLVVTLDQDVPQKLAKKFSCGAIRLPSFLFFVVVMSDRSYLLAT